MLVNKAKKQQCNLRDQKHRYTIHKQPNQFSQSLCFHLCMLISKYTTHIYPIAPGTFLSNPVQGHASRQPQADHKPKTHQNDSSIVGGRPHPIPPKCHLYVTGTTREMARFDGLTQPRSPCEEAKCSNEEKTKGKEKGNSRARERAKTRNQAGWKKTENKKQYRTERKQTNKQTLTNRNQGRDGMLASRRSALCVVRSCQYGRRRLPLAAPVPPFSRRHLAIVSLHLPTHKAKTSHVAKRLGQTFADGVARLWRHIVSCLVMPPMRIRR